jgi:hypothetical protein
MFLGLRHAGTSAHFQGLNICMERKEKNSKMETSEMQDHWKPTQ